MWNKAELGRRWQWKRRIAIIVVIFLYGIVLAAAALNTEGKVYEFSYNQMTKQLTNLNYRFDSDDYCILEETSAFVFHIKDSDAVWKYFCADIGNSDLKCNLVFLNQEKEVLSEQQIELKTGKNQIELKENQFWILKLEIKQRPGECFSICNMQIREQSENIIWNKVVVLSIVLSVIIGVILLFLEKRLFLFEKCSTKIGENLTEFAKTLGQCVPKCLTYGKKRVIRTGLFCIILGYLTRVEMLGNSYMINYASVHIWFVSGLLMILAAFCWEKDAKLKKTSIYIFVLLFLLFACISDFEVKKKFRYAAFAMFAFGGIFCKCWNSMEHKEHLISEFKGAYKLLFAVLFIYCIVCRPAYPGMCYSGYLSDTQLYGINVLFAYIVFLSDVQQKKTGIVNGIAAINTLYLIWLTQQQLLFLAAGVLSVIYLVCFLYRWIVVGTENKKRQLQKWLITFILGTMSVFIIRKIIFVLPIKIGTVIVYENEQQTKIEMTILEQLTNCNWKYFFMTKWLVCKEYLRHINLLGHANLTEFHGTARWPESRTVMNLFRYGAAAGVTYGLVLGLYFRAIVRYTKKHQDFFVIGLAVAGILAGLIAPMEKPFAQMGWIIFYFGICWMLTAGE